LCLLLEAVKHIDSSGELRNKNDPERPSGVPNSNFLNTRANFGIGFQSSGSLPRCTWSI